jgi:hypothetical protein
MYRSANPLPLRVPSILVAAGGWGCQMYTSKEYDILIELAYACVSLEVGTKRTYKLSQLSVMHVEKV